MNFRLLLILLVQALFLSACKKNKEGVLETPTLPAPISATPSKVIRYEEFDSVITAHWEYQLYTFDGNGCNMRQQNVTTKHSILSLRAEPNSDTLLPKKYNGGELGDRRFHQYGYFLVRMCPAPCSGTVSAFFLMNQWQPVNWEHKEIDIEFLGKSKTMIQCTTHDFQNGGKTWKSSSKTVPLHFDFSADFHDYGILWTPDSVSWFVDNKLIHSDTLYVPHEPLQIRLNYYVGDMAVKGFKEWLGNVDTTCLPSSTQYDWIMVEDLPSYRKRTKGN